MRARASILASSMLAAALGGYFGVPFVRAHGDATRHLPGRTSNGHHAIEEACSACHAPWGGVPNDRCNACHGEALAAADTHAESKFADPRNADRVAGLDARACVTCHRDHASEATDASGVSLPRDFCAACHQDVARERPSHAGFSFEACASTGCHRFHDNRALYEGFLARHLHEPDTRDPAAVAVLSHVARRAAPALDAPAAAMRPEIVAEWAGSAHAAAGIGCTACHGRKDTAWEDRPGRAACARCHAREEAGFLGGKHGMRLAAGLSPMTPAAARDPMKPEARDRALGCGSCHASHRCDTARAAVDACLSCHDDQHSRAYDASPHALLLRREKAGEGAPGTGVSCATCHLPRVTRRDHGADVVTADHDQSEGEATPEKMLRSVCLACHGLGFAIDALADADLVRKNFAGRPGAHVASLSMVERRLEEQAKRKERRP